MLRSLALLVAAFALASCSGPVSQETCDKAKEAGTWTVSFSLSQGDATKCPSLETKTLSLPDQCEANCGCTEASIVYDDFENSAVPTRCSLRFHETCPTYELDCRYVDVTSANTAGGDCFYKVDTLNCGYSVSWTKK